LFVDKYNIYNYLIPQTLDLRRTCMNDLALRYIFSIKSLTLLLLHKSFLEEHLDNITDVGLSYLVTDYVITNRMQTNIYMYKTNTQSYKIVIYVNFILIGLIMKIDAS
jgi:hypothetical protein